MSCFNGFDMADRDAYDAGYSYGPRRSGRHRPQCRSRVGVRNTHIECNLRKGLWFTGEKIADLSDEHLANCLELSRRKGYAGYIAALESEAERRANGMETGKEMM